MNKPVLFIGTIYALTFSLGVYSCARSNKKKETKTDVIITVDPVEATLKTCLALIDQYETQVPRAEHGNKRALSEMNNIHYQLSQKLDDLNAKRSKLTAKQLIKFKKIEERFKLIELPVISRI